MFVADLARLGKIETKPFKVQIVICRSNKSTPLILSKALVNWGYSHIYDTTVVNSSLQWCFFVLEALCVAFFFWHVVLLEEKVIL